MPLPDRLKKLPRDLFGQAILRATVSINLELGCLCSRLTRKEDPPCLRLSRDPDTLSILGGTPQVSRSRILVHPYGYLGTGQFLLHGGARPRRIKGPFLVRGFFLKAIGFLL